MWSLTQLLKIIPCQRTFYMQPIRKEMLHLSFPRGFFSPIVCGSNTFSCYCKKMLFQMEVYDGNSSKKLRKSLWKMSTYMMKASLSPSNACDGITFIGRWVNDLEKEEREERTVRHGFSSFTGCPVHWAGKQTSIKPLYFACSSLYLWAPDPFTIDLS